MKHLKLLLLISILFLSGCSSNEATQSVENTVTETPEPTATAAPTSEITSAPTPEITATPVSTEVPAVSELFTSVYVPFANREKSWYFKSVKSFAKSCGYTYEITKPTEDDIGQITISDSNGDYVYFAFMPSSGKDEIIMIVSFHQEESNTEVSVSNYSTDSSASYDTFSTQVIGEAKNEVSSIDEQQDFLFN